MGWTDDNDIEEEEETIEEEVQENDNGDEAMSEEPDLSELAPGAIGVDEAAEQEHTYKIMWWGNEGVGKTHASYTMPEPVCIIDTENKADDIAHKFTDKTVQIWQPDDFDESVDAVEQALSYLSEYQSQTGKTGTIVVDSMAVMWDRAKNKYIDKYYNNTDPEDVKLSLEDWAPIKKIHNERFRQKMEGCDFHVSWTSTRKDDVKSSIENDLDETPDKPGGETNNPYKVNSIIRLYLNSNGVPVGDLQKSGILRYKYIGLRRPTFPKHKEIVEEIEKIEEQGVDSAQEVKDRFSLDYNIEFTEANTMRFQQ